MFVVVRHPDVETPGILPAAALEHRRAHGWYRVSDYRREPSDFYLPEFAKVFDDLDEAPKTRRKPNSPAVPENGEEQ